MSGLRVEDAGGVRLITLDRPEARNAFSTDVYDGVGAALGDAAGSDELSVCVITGAEPGFSAGQDLKMLRGDDFDPKQLTDSFDRFARSLYAFDKPLLAAVNGPAVGIGVTMLCHCDIVYASDAARFRVPFVALDLLPEAASSVTLPARIGAQAAARFLLTGAWMEAPEALALGLVGRVCPPGDLLRDTMRTAAEIAAQPRAALVRAKRLVLAGTAAAVLGAHEREMAEMGRLLHLDR